MRQQRRVNVRQRSFAPCQPPLGISSLTDAMRHHSRSPPAVFPCSVLSTLTHVSHNCFPQLSSTATRHRSRVQRATSNATATPLPAGPGGCCAARSSAAESRPCCCCLSRWTSRSGGASSASTTAPCAAWCSAQTAGGWPAWSNPTEVSAEAGSRGSARCTRPEAGGKTQVLPRWLLTAGYCP